jgi:hypothetical protein
MSRSCEFQAGVDFIQLKFTHGVNKPLNDHVFDWHQRVFNWITENNKEQLHEKPYWLV